VISHSRLEKPGISIENSMLVAPGCIFREMQPPTASPGAAFLLAIFSPGGFTSVKGALGAETARKDGSGGERRSFRMALIDRGNTF